MSSLNKVQIIGRLGRDPEVTDLRNGGKVCNLSVATSEHWRDKRSGEKREKTEWHRVVTFNEHLVELADRFLRKGSLAFFEGQLQTRKWEDKEGIERYTTEIVLPLYRGQIVLLGGRDDDDEDERPRQRRQSQTTRRSTQARSNRTEQEELYDELDDEIPF